MTLELSEAGKHELALGLILWNDYQSKGQFKMDVSIRMFELARHVDITDHVQRLLGKVPRMNIEVIHPIRPREECSNGT